MPPDLDPETNVGLRPDSPEPLLGFRSLLGALGNRSGRGLLGPGLPRRLGRLCGRSGFGSVVAPCGLSFTTLALALAL